MRVLFNTYPTAFDLPGGGEVQILKVREALERRGVEVLLHDTWRPAFDDADLVHYFSVTGGSMAFCSHVKERGLPLVISTSLWITPRGAREYPLDEIRGLLDVCDRAMVNSRAEAANLSGFFGADPTKFAVYHNGVDPVFGEPATADAFREWSGLEGPYVLNVANVEPRKNQVRLARAARSLGMKLAVIGGVRDAEYLAKCAAEGGDCFRYLGRVDHGGELLRSAYAGCGVFALPSLLETPGLAALEAAAGGAKIVVTSEGCAREYFGEMADYADPLDEGAITRALRSAMARGEEAGLREHVLGSFTWDRSAGELVRTYSEVLEGAGRGG